MFEIFVDPLVKVYLLVKDKRVKKKKTAVRKGTCNPVWNEALTFSLSSSNLSNAAVEVKLSILLRLIKFTFLLHFK